MKPLKHLLLFPAFLLLFSCHDEAIQKPLPETGYPYTYQKLDDARLSVLISTFNQVNTNEDLTINSFGFLRGWYTTDKEITTPEGFILALEGLTTKYCNFMGISDISAIDIESDVLGRTTGGVNVSVKDYFTTELESSKKSTHYFSLTQKYIENHQIDYTEITFALNLEENKIGISGQWFPNAKVPENKIYSENEAVVIAKKCGEKDSGKNISTLDENTDVRQKVIPIFLENGYELHDCWCVTFWDIQYRFYIDTQTGEVVKTIDYSKYI